MNDEDLEVRFTLKGGLKDQAQSLVDAEIFDSVAALVRYVFATEGPRVMSELQRKHHAGSGILPAPRARRGSWTAGLFSLKPAASDADANGSTPSEPAQQEPSSEPGLPEVVVEPAPPRDRAVPAAKSALARARRAAQKRT